MTVNTKEKLLLANPHQHLTIHKQATGKPNLSPAQTHTSCVSLDKPPYFPKSQAPPMYDEDN